jgi:hypothetical protein
MRWIEDLWGVSFDGGNGLTETLFVAGLAVLAAAGVFAWVRKGPRPSSLRDRLDRRQARGR